MRLNLVLKILLIFFKLIPEYFFYFNAIKRTPNIRVDNIKPTPTKVAIIPVFKYTFTVASSFPCFLVMKKFNLEFINYQ